MKLKVILADNQVIFRTGIARVLAAEKDVTIIAQCGLDKHMAIVGYLKTEYQMGHGHANALVGWTLAGNTAAP